MSKYNIDLSGKVVVITGAGQGIGKGLAEGFAKAGASVVIADFQEKTGYEVEQSIRKANGEATYLKVDLSQETDIQKLIDVTVERYQGIDILINNARPFLTRGSFIETLGEWQLGLDILLNAPVLTIKHALPYLLKSPSACVLNISSTNAFFISEQPAVYHIAKAAILQATKYLAYEYGSQGVRFNAICPALVDVHRNNSPHKPDHVKKSITEAIVPLKRGATVEEITESALFLCSASASYITGEILTIDGGLTLGDHPRVAQMGYDVAIQSPIKTTP